MRHVIELFVAEHCPACPEARVRVREFAASRPDVIVIERSVSVERECETARQYGLFATPAVVIDGKTVLYGVPAMSKLAARCAGRSAATRQYGASGLRQGQVSGRESCPRQA
jgi:hypothetical protein